MSKHLKAIETLLGQTESKADAKDSPFLALQLEQLETEIYKTEYPDLMFRQVMPVKSSGLNPGAETFAYRVYDWFGAAKFISSKTEDLPLVDFAGEKFAGKFELLGAAFKVSLDELMAAAFAGVAIEAEKSSAAAESIERKLDSVAARGDVEVGFKGFLNHSDVTIIATQTAESVTTWAAKLALASGKGPTHILNDLHYAAQKIVTDSKGKIRPDRMVIPTQLYGLIATTPMNSTGQSDATILSTFLKTSPFIKSESQISVWYQADTASAGGTGRIVFYKADRRYMEFYESQPLKVLPGQPKGLCVTVPMYAKCGGLVLRMPPAIRYLDGAE
jgi:hypothetical protein